MPVCLENYYARIELVHISNELFQIKLYNAPTSQSPWLHFHYFYTFLSKNLHVFKIKSLTFYYINNFLHIMRMRDVKFMFIQDF